MPEHAGAGRAPLGDAARGEAHGVSHVGITVPPLFDDAQLHGAICLFTDLTAVKRSEEQLRLKDSPRDGGRADRRHRPRVPERPRRFTGHGKLIDLSALPEVSSSGTSKAYAPETESLGQVVTNFLNFACPAQLTLTDVDLRAICERAAEECARRAALGGDVSRWRASST